MNKKSIVIMIISMFFLVTSFTIVSAMNIESDGEITPTLGEIIVLLDYITIQEAINHAHEYNVIRVKAGIYYENIIVNVTALKIIGESPMNTIIEGCGSGNVVDIIGDTHMVQISGFRIQRGDIGVAFTTDNGTPTFNVLTGNIISNNRVGVELNEAAHYNTIYGNDFIDNGQHAYDSTDKNYWYNPEIKKGNYWMDYVCIEDNDNGVGNFPYNITGGNAQDIYPSIEPHCKNNKAMSSLLLRLFGLFQNALLPMRFIILLYLFSRILI